MNEVVVDQITVSDNEIILVRYATITKEDGKVVNKRYSYSSFAQGDDIADQPEIVQSVCNTVWAQ